MTNLAAQLQATLHVMGVRLQNRSEKGQTTAEYVGILAFVALLVMIVIGINTDIGTIVTDTITKVFDDIKGSL